MRLPESVEPFGPGVDRFEVVESHALERRLDFRLVGRERRILQRADENVRGRNALFGQIGDLGEQPQSGGHVRLRGGIMHPGDEFIFDRGRTVELAQLLFDPTIARARAAAIVRVERR